MNFKMPLHLIVHIISVLMLTVVDTPAGLSDICLSTRPWDQVDAYWAGDVAWPVHNRAWCRVDARCVYSPVQLSGGLTNLHLACAKCCACKVEWLASSSQSCHAFQACPLAQQPWAAFLPSKHLFCHLCCHHHAGYLAFARRSTCSAKLRCIVWGQDFFRAVARQTLAMLLLTLSLP